MVGGGGGVKVKSERGIKIRKQLADISHEGRDLESKYPIAENEGRGQGSLPNNRCVFFCFQ